MSVQSPVNEEKPVHPQETHQAGIPQVNTSTSVIPMGLLMPDCGEVITKQDLLDHGYPYDGLLPITKEKAYALFEQAGFSGDVYLGIIGNSVRLDRVLQYIDYVTAEH